MLLLEDLAQIALPTPRRAACPGVGVRRKGRRGGRGRGTGRRRGRGLGRGRGRALAEVGEQSYPYRSP